MSDKKHRCAAWSECAYWAWTQWQHPDNPARKLWICSNCSKLYQLDGWKPVEKEDKKDEL